MKSPIDFSLLWDTTAGYAVHCSDQSEAETFLEWVWELYPQACVNWEPDETSYYQHKNQTIYTFDSKVGGTWEKRQLLYGSVRAARDRGYTIIEFRDIFQEEDIEEVDTSLDMLFG